MSIAPQNLMSTLRMMPDGELASFARVHQNDPIVFPLVFKESQDRQRLRAAKQAQAAGQQQLKVVEQDLQQIEQAAQPEMQAPQQIAQADTLPEDMGIGQLPAQNLQTISKASGGIVAFAGNDGSQVKDRDAIVQYIVSESRRLGIDPNLAMRMFTQESGLNAKAVSPKGAAGLGQLMPKTAKGLGLSEEDRFDPAKNVTASLTYLKSMMNKYGGDATKAVAAYNWGPGNLDKHLKKNEGAINPIGLPKETANYITKLLPFSEARAEDAELAKRRNMAPTISPAKAAPKVDASVPTAVSTAPTTGASADMPLVSPERRANYGMWDSIKSYYESPSSWEGVKRNIGNSIDALSGWSSPLLKAGRAIGSASGELAATPEMIKKAEEAARIANTPRLTAPVAQGIAELAPEAVAARQAATAARQARALEQDVAAAKAAQQSIDAAKLTSEGALGVEKGIAQLPRTAGTLSTQASTAARANMAGNMIDDMMEAPAEAKVTPIPTAEADKTEGKTDADEGIQKLVDGKGKADAAGKGGAGGLGGLFNDPMFLMGMNLMAGKSPYLAQNIGEAGIATAGALQSQRAAETDRMYREAMAKHYGVDPFVQRLEALKDPEKLRMFQKMKELEREPTTKESLFKQFMSSPTALGLKAEEVGPAFQKYVQSYEQMFGPLGGMPTGVKVTPIG